MPFKEMVMNHVIVSKEWMADDNRVYADRTMPEILRLALPDLNVKGIDYDTVNESNALFIEICFN